MADAAAGPHATLDLWHDLRHLLDYPFMQNAFAAGTIVAVVAGVIGYFVVLRGQAFAAHTLSQVGFPGAAGAALIGAAPVAGLLVFCIAAGCGIGLLSDHATARGRSDSAAIGSILAFASALGFLFATLYHGFISGVYAFLFGTFIGITDTQVLILLLTAVPALAAMAVIARPLLFASVDAEAAAARGVPVRALSMVFLVLLALAVAEAVQITGTLLVFALLVAPAATAQRLSARPVRGVVLSVLLAVLFTWVGLAIAYYTIYPIGFLVTSIAFAAYLLARTWRAASGGLRRRPQPAATG